MSLLKRILAKFAPKEIIEDMEKRKESELRHHLRQMGEAVRELSLVREGAISHPGVRELTMSSTGGYLDYLKDYRVGMEKELSRSQLHRFDTAIREFEQQYKWTFQG